MGIIKSFDDFPSSDPESSVSAATPEEGVASPPRWSESALPPVSKLPSFLNDMKDRYIAEPIEKARKAVAPFVKEHITDPVVQSAMQQVGSPPVVTPKEIDTHTSAFDKVLKGHGLGTEETAKRVTDWITDPSNLLWFVPLGEEVKAAAEGGQALGPLATLGRLAKSAIFGAGFGALSSLVHPGEKVEDAALSGAEFNTTLHAGAEGIGRALSLGKPLVMAGSRYMQALMDELKGIPPDVTKEMPGNFKPTLAAIHFDEEDTPRVKLVEPSTKREAKIVDLDLDKAKDRETFATIRKGAPSLQVISGDDRFFDKSDAWKRQVFGGTNPDQVVSTSNGPHLVLVGSDGRLHFSPVQDHPATLWAPPSEGEKVLVHKPGEPPQLAIWEQTKGKGSRAVLSPLSNTPDIAGDEPTVGRAKKTPPFEAPVGQLSKVDETVAATEADRQKRGLMGPGAASGDDFNDVTGRMPTQAAAHPKGADPSKTLPQVNTLNSKPAAYPALTPPPGMMPPDVLRKAQEVSDWIQRGKNAQPGLGHALSRGFLDASVDNALPGDYRSNLLMQRSASYLKDEVQKSSLRSLVSGGSQLNTGDFAPFQMGGEFDQAVKKVLDEKAPASSLERFPEYAGFKSKMDPMLQRKDFLDKALNALGYVKDEAISQRAAGQLPAYLARSYLGKMYPKEWGIYAEKNLLTQAVQDIQNEHLAAGRSAPSSSEIAASLHDSLASNDPIGSLKGSSVGRLFKGRKDIPESLRKYMGEINSGAWALSESLGKQEALYSQLKAMAEWAKDPEVTSDLRKPGWKQLPDNPEYGFSRGKWVHPQLFDDIASIPNSVNQGSNIFTRLFNKGVDSARVMRKQNLINPLLNGPSALIHHMFGGLGTMDGAVLAGGIDPFHPIESGKLLKQASQSLMEYAHNPYGSGAAEQKLEALRFGAISPGFGDAELDSAGKKMLRYFNEQMQGVNGDFFDHLQTGTNAFEKFKGALSAGKGAMSSMAGAGSEFYDTMNHSVQLASYIGNKNKFLAQGMPYEQAVKEAAWLNSQSFANFHNTGPFVKSLNKGVGAAAPFLTPLAERMRIAAQIPGRILNGEKDLPIKITKLLLAKAAVLGAGTAVAQMHGMNLGDLNMSRLGEIAKGVGGIGKPGSALGLNTPEAVDGFLSERQKEYYPVTYTLPFLDEKGRRVLADATHYIPFADLLRGNPQAPFYQRVMANLTMAPLEGTPFENQGRKFWSKLSVMSPPFEDHAKNTEASFLGMLHDANRNGYFGPPMISRVGDEQKRAQANDLTGGEQIADLSGNRVFPERGGGGTGKLDPVLAAMANHVAEAQVMSHQLKQEQKAKPGDPVVTAKQAHLQAQTQQVLQNLNLIQGMKRGK